MQSKKSHFKLSFYINRDAKWKITACDIFRTDVHRSSYAIHLKNKKRLEITHQEDMITSNWLFQEPNENIPRRIYNPKPSKETAREKFKKDDEELP